MNEVTSSLLLLVVLIAGFWCLVRYINKSRPKPVAQAPTRPSTPAPSAADRRTDVFTTPRGELKAANLSALSMGGYTVSVESTADDYRALYDEWVDLRPERETTAFLRPDPAAPNDTARVIVETSRRGRIGCLPAIEAELYHGVIAALAGRGLTGSAGAKIVGGAGSRARVALKLNLDSPRRIAADFAIPDEQIAPPAAVTPVTDPSSPGAPSLATGRGFYYDVTGTSHYQEPLRRLLTDTPGRTFTARLVAEPTNPHDPNAVAVHDPKGTAIAHLPADDAPLYARLLQELLTHSVSPVCPAQLVGGTDDKPIIGLRLDLDRPTNIAKRVGIVLS